MSPSSRPAGARQPQAAAPQPQASASQSPQPQICASQPQAIVSLAPVKLPAAASGIAVVVSATPSPPPDANDARYSSSASSLKSPSCWTAFCASATADAPCSCCASPSASASDSEVEPPSPSWASSPSPSTTAAARYSSRPLPATSPRHDHRHSLIPAARMPSHWSITRIHRSPPAVLPPSHSALSVDDIDLALHHDDKHPHTACVALTVPASVAVPTLHGRFTRWSTAAIAPEKIMALVSEQSVLVPPEDAVPASPPGLVYSKSSKSSYSLPSDSDDQLSDIALNDDSTHFEDLTLDDPPESLDDSNLPPASRPTLRRPAPRATPAGHPAIPPAMSPPLKQVPNGRRQLYPSLHGAVSTVLREQTLTLPPGRTSRSQSSPTSPSAPFHPPAVLSRSPSPRKRWGPHGYSYVIPQTQPPAHPASRNVSSPASQRASPQTSESGRPMPRRMSWQPPTRKTVQELEDEYNDADEDVPDEAILENVPISPMPGHPTSSFLRSSSTTNLRSLTPSPHRRPSYANLHSANIPKNAKRPSAPPSFSNGHHYSSPRSPNTANGRPPLASHPTAPGYVRSADSQSQRPPVESSAATHATPVLLSQQHRSKSWTEDLNEEAWQLTQALEQYTDQLSSEKRASGSSSVASSPPRPSIAKHRSKTSTAELPTVPPVQKSNVMIDPLPISKEKEAVLTRTRPSWLPPKDPKEEKRHLKEFQQMMARAAEAERKRELRDREARESREEMQDSLARIWDQHVLPNWDDVIREPRTRELWWRGVTPRSRGEVWQRAIGNELELSSASFEAALARAASLEEKIAEMSEEERIGSREAAWLAAIARDVPDTLPELHMYQTGAALHESLTAVLKAYAMYRSDVGYVYGTHLVAGIICMLLPPPEAFVMLANLLNRPLPLAFLVHDQVAMAHTYDLVLSTLKYKFTKLHDHLTSPALGLAPADFLDPLFRCLFAYDLPHPLATRIWDVYMFEGDRVLIRAAVAVLGRLEPQLYGSRAEILALLAWSSPPDRARWDLGDEETFVQALRDAGKVDARVPLSGATASVPGTAPSSARPSTSAD